MRHQQLRERIRLPKIQYLTQFRHSGLYKLLSSYLQELFQVCRVIITWRSTDLKRPNSVGNARSMAGRASSSPSQIKRFYYKLCLISPISPNETGRAAILYDNVSIYSSPQLPSVEFYSIASFFHDSLTSCTDCHLAAFTFSPQLTEFLKVSPR